MGARGIAPLWSFLDIYDFPLAELEYRESKNDGKLS